MFERNGLATEWIGLEEGVAKTRAARIGVERVRVYRVVSGHADHRSGRLNLVVDGGVVVLAAFF